METRNKLVNYETELFGLTDSALGQVLRVQVEARVLIRVEVRNVPDSGISGRSNSPDIPYAAGYPVRHYPGRIPGNSTRPKLIF